MKVKVKENLEVNKYYEGVIFLKGKQQYKGKTFNIKIINVHHLC